MTSTKSQSLDIHRATGKLKDQQAVILSYLRSEPIVPLSRNEIARWLGIPIQSVCARINELVGAGLVADDVKRKKDEITGRTVKLVFPTPDLLS